MILDMDVRGQCEEHDPPHTVDITTNDEGGRFPELECGGTVLEFEVDAVCECGEDLSGYYDPKSERLPEHHECDEDEDEGGDEE